MPSTPTNSTNSSSAATPATGAPSTTSTTKPRAAKKAAPKPEAAEGTLIDKSLQKTTRKSSPKAAAKQAEPSFEKPAEAEWHRLISEAAYYRAESRGFHPGHEHEDWVWAEEEVRRKLARE